MRRNKKTKEIMLQEKGSLNAQCIKDYALTDWTVMSLFDEYLEMSKIFSNSVFEWQE
jgi:hypothetical protein